MKRLTEEELDRLIDLYDEIDVALVIDSYLIEKLIFNRYLDKTPKGYIEYDCPHDTKPELNIVLSNCVIRNCNIYSMGFVGEIKNCTFENTLIKNVSFRCESIHDNVFLGVEFNNVNILKPNDSEALDFRNNLLFKCTIDKSSTTGVINATNLTMLESKVISSGASIDSISNSIIRETTFDESNFIINSVENTEFRVSPTRKSYFFIDSIKNSTIYNVETYTSYFVNRGCIIENSIIKDVKMYDSLLRLKDVLDSEVDNIDYNRCTLEIENKNLMPSVSE